MEVPAVRDSVDSGRGGSWKEEPEARRVLMSGGRGGGWNEEFEVRRPLLDVSVEALMDVRPSVAMFVNDVDPC